MFWLLQASLIVKLLSYPNSTLYTLKAVLSRPSPDVRYFHYTTKRTFFNMPVLIFPPPKLRELLIYRIFNR